MIRQYGAKRLRGLGYLRRLGCLPEGVLAAGQTGSSLVFLFGVIGVDAGKPSKYPSIQVSKYPSIQGQNLTQELCLTVMMPCVVQTPMSRSYGPPCGQPQGSPQVPAGYPPGVDRAAACRMRVWAVFQIICLWVMSWGSPYGSPI